ncbi:GntR family transcriptional regulator [Cellulomonas dongxiuzhuiae]|uniref:GntR family transcriptional regulator n=1 Tax=Cellulomonas dongxiuzhuiae TaxID=2819979 RepID=A0ABX8GJI6_9CELL|nr:GntR family transcriptional regulator [Cellulomonas dongxiuzhuiae]MBO3089604.1 GntR family transcriptional regulator [Cellulomonas dongxiuzhuiae]MBO3095242.1 GntR family transcriptional regulator [Cellulomonas dongxiuzhuiae]QWC16239.1 GntR family transcriptional regulator [Cellulomonas dongxiuzhuiae]
MPPRSFEELERERLVHSRARRRTVADRHTSPRRAYEQLRSAIRSGRLLDGRAFDEQRLVDELGASRNSVRSALQHLTREGLLERRTKTGTQVRHPFMRIPIGELLPSDVTVPGRYPQVVVHDLGSRVSTPDPEVETELETGRDVLVMEHVGLFGGTPAYHRIAYLPLHDPPEVVLARVAALHEQLLCFAASFRSIFGCPAGEWKASVEAVAADAVLAAHLTVPERSPVLLRELVLRDSAGRVRDLSFTHFRGDMVAIGSTSHARPVARRRNLDVTSRATGS